MRLAFWSAESYFRFITDPDIDPTNNTAEQGICFVAILGRLTQGTRGENGRQWFERIATVVVMPARLRVPDTFRVDSLPGREAIFAPSPLPRESGAVNVGVIMAVLDRPNP